MESLEKQYDHLLVRLFGIQVEKDLEVLKQKFALVVAAHLFEGTLGGSVFCQLNRLFEEELKKVFEKKEVKK